MMNNEENEYKEFLCEYEDQIVDLQKNYHLAYYNAICSGKSEDYDDLARLDIEVNNFYLNSELFQKLKFFKESGKVVDPLLRRQLDLQCISFLVSMSDKKKINEIVSLQTEIEKKFNSYRVVSEGRQITDNEIENILTTSKDSLQLRAVWEQSKDIGKLVSDDIIKLVKLRNEHAVRLGFKNYQEMAMKNSELDPMEIESIFDELDLATKNIYQKAKNGIDEALAKYYDVDASKLGPWHLQNRFFQEVPNIFDVNMDNFYENKDVLTITKDYYSRIGMPVDDIIERSDLYERSGKSQHAMADSIDKKNDVRIVTNIKNNSQWTGTLLHEFAHAIYFQKIDQQLPWELRDPAHILTTEAIALFFQDMIYSPDWMKIVLELDNGQINKIKSNVIEYGRLNKLIFSRWAQVMYRFEKSMYENPDQDLNSLWWDLVEKYQLIKKPEGRNSPDWASKIHIASSPVYYHNYMLGHLYAAQIKHYINTNILKLSEEYPIYIDKSEISKYLIEEIFAPGNRYPWNILVEKSTNEKLNIGHFVNEVTK